MHVVPIDVGLSQNSGRRSPAHSSGDTPRRLGPQIGISPDHITSTDIIEGPGLLLETGASKSPRHRCSEAKSLRSLEDRTSAGRKRSSPFRIPGNSSTALQPEPSHTPGVLGITFELLVVSITAGNF